MTPIDDLLATMRKIGTGDLTAQPSGVGPPELREVASELGQMTMTLAQDRSRMAAVESEVRSQARRLELIVNVGREISGSLSLRYVAEAVGRAAVKISGFESARMWIINDPPRELNVVHDTDLEHGQSSDRAAVQLGEGLMGRSGQFGRTLSTLATGSLATEYRAGVPIAQLRARPG